MRLPRLTTRRLMLIVAGAAVLMAGPAKLWQRSMRFEGLALAHREEIRSLQFSDLELYLALCSVQADHEGTPAERRRSLEEFERYDRVFLPLRTFCEYHAGQAVKYEAAAARPWSSVATDSLPPRPTVAYLKAIRAWMNGDFRALAAYDRG